MNPPIYPTCDTLLAFFNYPYIHTTLDGKPRSNMTIDPSTLHPSRLSLNLTLENIMEILLFSERVIFNGSMFSINVSHVFEIILPTLLYYLTTNVRYLLYNNEIIEVFGNITR